MQSFEFHRPASVSDAIEAIKGASEGKFMAGGQSLLPVIKLDLAAPSDVILRTISSRDRVPLSLTYMRIARGNAP